MRRFWRKIPRQLRFALDALLVLALLTAVYVAMGCPILGETALFRRAEKANLMGPSKIIDRLDVPKDWPTVSWDRLLIGDDGEEIVLWFHQHGAGSGTLKRLNKTDGILLLPLPECGAPTAADLQKDCVVPLFLFVDDPAAVKATMQLRLSETDEITLTQVRGGTVDTRAGDPGSRERYFLFHMPVTREEWTLKRGELIHKLLDSYTNARYRPVGYQATILLYDAEDRLIETREWTL
jgi:hypothetical protein